MAVTIEQVKNNLRIDGTAEDDVLTKLIADAESYVKAAVDDYDTNLAASTDYANLAARVQLALIADMYDRRGTGDGIHDYSMTIRSMVNQLKYWPDSTA